MGIENKTSQGYFTSAGTAKYIALPYLPKSFTTLNKTNQSSTANPGVVKRAQGFYEDTDGTAYLVKNTAGAATDESSVVTSNGFTFITKDTPRFGSNLTITGITQANPAVVTTGTHGLVTGDTVMITGTTGMLQVAGAMYVVTVLSSTTFSIPVDSSGFGAAATAGTAKKVLYPDLYTPDACYITAVTKASSAVVTTSIAHNMVVGQEVYFIVPSQWGMTQLDSLKGYVTAVTSNTLTVNINSSGFTTFAYPTSATAALAMTFAQVIPIGDANTGYSGPTVPQPQTIPGGFAANTSQGVILGTTVAGANNDVIHWKAEYPDQFLTS